MSFEETAAELKSNVASLGVDLAGLVRRKKIVLDHVFLERSEIQETGDYDLEGLFVRLNHAIETIGAKRVVLPITSLGLDHKVSTGRISTGIPRLDAMLSGKGFCRGSSVLLTGTPGTGKTSVAACFAQAAPSITRMRSTTSRAK